MGTKYSSVIETTESKIDKNNTFKLIDLTKFDLNLEIKIEDVKYFYDIYDITRIDKKIKIEHHDLIEYPTSGYEQQDWITYENEVEYEAPLCTNLKSFALSYGNKKILVIGEAGKGKLFEIKEIRKYPNLKLYDAGFIQDFTNTGLYGFNTSIITLAQLLNAAKKLRQSIDEEEHKKQDELLREKKISENYHQLFD